MSSVLRVVDPRFLLAAALSSTSLASDGLVTAAERSGFVRTGRYAEVIELCDAFAQAYAAQARHGFDDYVSYVQKHGRARFIEIHVVLPADYPVDNVATLDRLREEISTGLGAPDAARWLTISFTGDRKWIA